MQPNKYDPIHVILMGAAPLFAILAAKWPLYWPAFGAALLLAYYIAIWTHKPGAAKVIAELQGDAARAKPPSIPPIVGAMLVVILVAAFACTERETAKDAYTLQSDACLVAYTARADQETCLTNVRNRWTKAGAPPATIQDGGIQ